MSLYCVPHYFQRAETPFYEWLQHFFHTAVTEWVRRWSDSSLPLYFSLPHSLIYSHTGNFYQERSSDPVDCSSPGSSAHGILQARVLEWVAISFSRGSSPPRDWTQISCIAGRRFTFWATREAPILSNGIIKSFKRHGVLHFTMEEVDSQSSIAAAMAGLCLPHPNSYVEVLPQPPHCVV